MFTRTLAAVGVVGALLFAAPLAHANDGDLTPQHTPTYGTSCGPPATQLPGFYVSLTNYPGGSHVKVTLDSVVKVDQDFTPAYANTWDWSADVAHTWAIVVTSPDGIGQVNDHGTSTPCVAPTTPAPTTTTSTSTPPTTAAPIIAHLSVTATPPPCGEHLVHFTATNTNPYDGVVQVDRDHQGNPMQKLVPANSTVEFDFWQELDTTAHYDAAGGSVHLPDGTNPKVLVDGGPWDVTTTSSCETPTTPVPPTTTPPATNVVITTPTTPAPATTPAPTLPGTLPITGGGEPVRNAVVGLLVALAGVTIVVITRRRATA